MSSFDSQFLNIPIRSLLIDGSVFPVVVREVTIRRGSGMHDSVELSVLIEGEMTFSGKARIPLSESTTETREVDIETLEGQTVAFVYGIPPWTENFYGYILEVRPNQKFKQGLNYVIQMAGTTLMCQRINRRFYTNMTDLEMAKEIADRALLGFSTNSSSTYRWPSTGVVSRTDWETLNQLAARSGLLLFNWGGVVRMDDPRLLFNEYPYTRLVSSDDVLETDRKLMDFSPTARGFNEAATRPVEFFFFDRNGQVVSYKKAGRGYAGRYIPYSTSPVMNGDEADIFAKSSENSISRWLHSATARVKGDASITPGVTVDVDTGAREASARFNGRWLVMQVTHSMNRTAFNTELVLTRPGDRIPPLVKSSFDPFWRSSAKPKPTITVRSGQWFSSWASPLPEVRS